VTTTTAQPLPNPIAQLRTGRLPRRLVQLYLGLVLYGASMALMIESGLGLDPWDVLHYGITRHVPLSFGTVVIVISFVVLLLWIPLRQWPGVGTISNAIVVGLATDLGLWLLAEPDVLWLRIAFLALGIFLNAVATAAYIGAHLGPGPRDGLMTGLVRRTGRSVRLVRTSLELSVLVIGWLLGGVVGVGTVAYAVLIGPLAHVLMPRFEIRTTEESAGV
jgi:uncharacterized membrane protein YczE